MSIAYKNKKFETDKEGYLQDLEVWTEELAVIIAEKENIKLTQDHWELVHLIREFYLDFELSPAMRPLVKYINKKLGKDKGSSIYLLSLFPGSPAKVLSKIAGLPRPTNCL